MEYRLGGLPGTKGPNVVHVKEEKTLFHNQNIGFQNSRNKTKSKWQEAEYIWARIIFIEYQTGQHGPHTGE